MQNSAQEDLAHPIDYIIFFGFAEQHSDVGFGFWRGRFGAVRVNRRFALAALRFAAMFLQRPICGARLGKSCGAGRLELNRSAPPDRCALTIDPRESRLW